MNDPLVKEVRKARRVYKNTKHGQLNALLDEGRKWSRRLTIAENKHRAVLNRVIDFAETLAIELDKREQNERQS
jgi:hypothetical protein